MLPQQIAFLWRAWLKCLHVIAGTNQTLRFINYGNLKPFTQTHVETRGAHVWLLGAWIEEGNNPMESKGLKCEDYQPHPANYTELMSTFELSPSLHLLLISLLSLWVARVKSLLSLFSWCRILQATPGHNLKIKGRKGWWRERGHRKQVSKALWWKGDWKGVPGNQRSRCLLVSVLNLVSVRHAGIHLEQIHLQGPWAHLQSSTFIRCCQQADSSNGLFICLRLNAVMIYNFQSYRIYIYIYKK